MPLTSGTSLGPYKILAPLGSGGMGEVYRAHDSRLGRDVAIKVLSPHLAATPEVRARFEREARTISQLSHPHICTLHDIGHQDGTDYLVMELLEGETLAHRLEKGPLPIAEVLSLGAQIADALDRAHRAGVVHRDLKPGNVMLTKAGAKLMDFGLARAAGLPAAAPGALTESPTVSRPLTKEGTIVGTFQYMAPEQLEGKEADARTDLWALGCVLYEMATGKRAFEGESQASLIAAILKEEPRSIADLQPLTPPAFERIVKHCLEKSPDARFQSARDLAFALESLSGAGLGVAAGPAAAGSVTKRRRFGLTAAAFLTVAAVLIGFGLGTFRQASTTSGAPRPVYQRLTIQQGLIWSARFSPDGKTVFYCAAWEDRPVEIFETRPGSMTSRALGLADAYLASISKSGTMALTLGQTDISPWPGLGTLAQAPMSGGAPRRVLDDVWGADWSSDGRTLAVVHQVGGIVRLEMPPGHVLYQTAGWITCVRVSPSGRWLAFLDNPVPWDWRGSAVIMDRGGRVAARTSEWNCLSGVAWSPDGSEAWFCGSQDLATTEIRAMRPDGRQRVMERLPGRAWLYDVGQDGRVLLGSVRNPVGIRGRGATDPEERELGWLDLSIPADISADGKTLLFDEEGLGGGPLYSVHLRSMDGAPAAKLGEGHARALSPDGRWALAIHFGPPHRLLLLPTGAGDSTSLPRGPIELYYDANWLPDGKRVVFVGSEHGRAMRTYVQDVASGLPRAVTPEGLIGVHASPDGRFVAAMSADRLIQLCPVEGGESRVIGESPPGEVVLRWSADGRYLFVGAVKGRGGVISRLDLRTGARTPWKTVGPPETAGARVGPPGAITPDGRSYAYTYWSKLDELYVVDGLK